MARRRGTDEEEELDIEAENVSKEELDRREADDEKERAEIYAGLEKNGSPIEDPNVQEVELRAHPDAKVMFTMRLHPDTVAQLGAIARERKTTRGAVAREMIENALASGESSSLIDRVSRLEKTIAEVVQGKG